jgi:hypothetical protein
MPALAAPRTLPDFVLILAGDMGYGDSHRAVREFARWKTDRGRPYGGFPRPFGSGEGAARSWSRAVSIELAPFESTTGRQDHAFGAPAV